MRDRFKGGAKQSVTIRCDWELLSLGCQEGLSADPQSVDQVSEEKNWPWGLRGGGTTGPELKT